MLISLYKCFSSRIENNLTMINHSTNLTHSFQCTRFTQWLDESFHQRFVLELIVTSSSLNKIKCNVYLMNRIRIDIKHVKKIKNRLYKSLNSSQIENQLIINSSINVIIDITSDVTSFDEFTQHFELNTRKLFQIV
jgi:hypothetical protein